MTNAIGDPAGHSEFLSSHKENLHKAFLLASHILYSSELE